MSVEEMEREDEQEEEAPPEWEDHTDLNCETMLSARSTMSEPAEGMLSKAVPCQARNGWDGDEDAGRTGEFAMEEPRFGLLKERSSLFSPSGPAEFAPLSRNASGIMVGDDIPSMSRNVSGIISGGPLFGRFDSLDWSTPMKEEGLEGGFSLARQLSGDINGFLA